MLYYNNLNYLYFESIYMCLIMAAILNLVAILDLIVYTIDLKYYGCLLKPTKTFVDIGL